MAMEEVEEEENSAVLRQFWEVLGREVEDWEEDRERLQFCLTEPIPKF